MAFYVETIPSQNGVAPERFVAWQCLELQLLVALPGARWPLLQPAAQ